MDFSCDVTSCYFLNRSTDNHAKNRCNPILRKLVSTSTYMLLKVNILGVYCEVFFLSRLQT